MAWNMLENLTSSGNVQTDLVSTFTAPAQAFPNLWAIIVLLPLFFILTMRTFFTQKEKEGRGNLWSSLAVSSFVTALVALVMNLIGLVTGQAFSWVVGITLIFGILYILLKD